MSSLKFDLSKTGLQCVLKPYQVEIMKYFWDTKTPQGSRSVHRHLQTFEGDLAKSRAAVIIFLTMMVDEGFLSYETVSSKGGYKRVYSLTQIDEQAFKDRLYWMFHDKLQPFRKGA